MKRFSWIKLIPVLIHLKYWYYNTPSQELPSFPYHLFNTSLHVFHLFPYFVLPNLTTCHKYWTYWPHDKPSHSNLLSSYIQIIKTYGQHATHQEAEPLGATCLSKLDNMVNKNSIFNKNVQNSLQNGKRSLIFTNLLVHTTTSPIFTKSPLLHFSQFSPPYSILLVHKTILTIPTNTLFLYNWRLFFGDFDKEQDTLLPSYNLGEFYMQYRYYVKAHFGLFWEGLAYFLHRVKSSYTYM